MKNKLYYVYIIIVAILIVASFLYQQRTIHRLKQQTYEIVGKMRTEYILLKEGFFHTYDFENIPLDYAMTVQNFNGDTTTLRELFSGQNTLVVFMSSIGTCNCVHDNIRITKNWQKKLAKIIFCIDGLSHKEFKSFVSQNDIKNTAYLLPPNSYNGFAINPVIYFVVDDSVKANFFYAPSLVFPDLTEVYLDKINNMVTF